MDIFDLIKPEFNSQENWGDPSSIDRHLLLIIYCIRCDLKFPMSIHCGVEPRKSGFHPLKKAVDFHFICDLELESQYTILEGYLENKGWDKLVGLGVYPDWNYPGFHLDTRGIKARWGRINKSEYVTITEALKWILN